MRRGRQDQDQGSCGQARRQGSEGSAESGWACGQRWGGMRRVLQYGAMCGAVRCESKEIALARYIIPHVQVVYGRLCPLCSRGLRDCETTLGFAGTQAPGCWLAFAGLYGRQGSRNLDRGWGGGACRGATAAQSGSPGSPGSSGSVEMTQEPDDDEEHLLQHSATRPRSES